VNEEFKKQSLEREIGRGAAVPENKEHDDEAHGNNNRFIRRILNYSILEMVRVALTKKRQKRHEWIQDFISCGGILKN